MRFAYFLSFFDTAQPTREIGAEDLAQVAELIEATPGLTRGLLFAGVQSVAKYYPNDDAPPQLAMELYFDAIEDLEGALAKDGHLQGLLGTEATVRQRYVDDLEREFAKGKTLLRYGANDLVALGEAKLRGDTVSVDAVADAAKGLVLQENGQDLDTVVLACTHFPLLEPELREAFGPEVRFIHGADGIARRIASLVEGQAFERAKPDFAVTTGPADDFDRLAPAFARHGIEHLVQF